MTEQIKEKLIFNSPYGSKVTIERMFNNRLAIEEYIKTMTKMGYVVLTEKSNKIDTREEGVGC